MTAGLAAVALGGGLGAAARYLVSVLLSSGPAGFPWATLAVNLAGCLGIGLLWGSCSQASWFQEWGRAFLVVGLLGGFTTFSAFSLETLWLVAADRLAAAAAYAAGSLVGCVAMAWLGLRWAEG